MGSTCHNLHPNHSGLAAHVAQGQVDNLRAGSLQQPPKGRKCRKIINQKICTVFSLKLKGREVTHSVVFHGPGRLPFKALALN